MKWGWAWRGLTGYHGGLRESPNAEVLQITYLVSYYGFFRVRSARISCPTFVT